MDWDMNQDLLEEDSEEQSGTGSESDNLVASNDYDNDHHNCHDDFLPSTSLTWDDDSDSEYDSNMSNPMDDTNCNAHGVVHVRMLQARNLPCPVGSSVRATVSLQPYKGKIKSPRATAVSNNTLPQYGVSVKWDTERRIDEYLDEYDDDENYCDNDDENLLSMVNGWSSPLSPIPSIRIDLTFSPLGIGIFDFTMASLELSTTRLLKHAGVWRERWCIMTVATSSASSHENCYGNPSIKIKAVFVPTGIPRTAGATPPKKITTVPPSSIHSDGPSHVENQCHPNINNDDGNCHSGISQFGNSSNIKTVSAKNDWNCDDDQHILSQSSMGNETKNNEIDNPHHRVCSVERMKEDTSFILDAQEELSLPIDTAPSIGDASTIASRKTTNSQMLARDAASLRCPHLLRAQTYWAPSNCAVCSRILVGISNGVGFRCEVCQIDCCSDCRIHVDLRVPCGSDLAQEIMETSFRNKLTASSFFSYIAPDAAYMKKRRSVLEDVTMQSSNAAESIATEGIGRCRFEIITACLFMQNISSWDHTGNDNVIPSSLRKGDYYVRISTSDSGKSNRTPTLQFSGGMPNFQSAEMKFSISHYGVQYRIDVVESDTDMIIGSAVLTTQGILQAQRDLYISEHGVSLFQSLKGPIPWMGKQKMRLSLRSGIKGDASTDDFFSLSTPKGNASLEKNGAVSGWIDIFVGIEELYSRLYGPNANICPNRPDESLNMAKFSNYIGRITAIIEDLRCGFTRFQYIISWEDPLLTALSLCLFIGFCLRFNAEYSGSLPIIFLIIVLIYFAIRRTQGKIKSSYIRKEIETMQKVLEVNAVGYSIYRPRGTIRVKVTKGRNLITAELGIAGNTSCKVIWDPTRLVDDDKKKKQIARSDKSADTPLEIGSTSTLYTADPDWSLMEESGIVKKLNQLLPSAENDFFEPSSISKDENTGIEELAFPILQPFEFTTSSNSDGKLQTWESSKGAIVIQVNFYNNILGGFDQVLGEVVFPFSELAREKEVKGWFQILDVGTSITSPLADHDMGGEDQSYGMTLNPPRIHIHLKWDPPSPFTSAAHPSDDEKEMSRAIQEELVRSSILSKENKFNLVNSSLGAVNRAIGIGGTVQVVQNTLGSILDLVEGIINMVNFTDPFKSSYIIIVLLLIWFVFIIIPTRYIFLSSGLVQYGITFYARYGKVLMIKKYASPSLFDSNAVNKDEKKKSSPFSVWIINAIRSMPTNEDLRKAYFWESCQLGSEKAKKYALEKRECRLKKLWKAKWYCSASVLVQDKEIDLKEQVTFHWNSGCFAVIQGHRFIWWNSVTEFDDGEIPSGKVLLSGHFGLASPSPIEMRSLNIEKELPLCITIFGRGSFGQERVILLLPNKRVKEDLENAVIDSGSFKID